MKRPSHKQFHRILIAVFVVVLLFGLGLVMLVSVQTAARTAADNVFPIAQDRTNL
jgi:uncharacterized BrkB/YihY/UPF0761 family membrane protein